MSFLKKFIVPPINIIKYGLYKKTELIPVLWSNDDPENSEETDLWCVLMLMRQVQPDSPCVIHELDVRHPMVGIARCAHFDINYIKICSFFLPCLPPAQHFKGY